MTVGAGNGGNRGSDAVVSRIAAPCTCGTLKDYPCPVHTKRDHPQHGLTTPNMARCFGGPLDGEWFPYGDIGVSYRRDYQLEPEVDWTSDPNGPIVPEPEAGSYVIAKYGFLLPRPPYRWVGYAWVPEGSTMARRIELILQALVAWANHGLAP